MDFKKIVHNRLFDSVPENDIERIFSSGIAKEQTFKKGDILAIQDEPCNRLIILLTGSVKAEMSDPSGRIVKVEDIYAPSPLAILFLFGKKNRFPVQVTAQEDLSALIIPQQAVLKMLGQNEQLLKNYLDICAMYASTLSERLHFLSFRTIRQKLAIYFLELAKGGSDKIVMDRSQKDLAEFFGVSRPALAREIKNMENDGLIVSERNRVEIKKRNELSHIIRFS